MAQSNSPAVRMCSIFLLCVSVIGAGFLGFRVWFRTPWFEKVFLDFNCRLPDLTLWMLSPWFQLVVPGIALLAIIKEWLPNKTVTLVLNCLILAILVAIHELYTIAMVEPFVDIFRKIAGN